MGGHDYLAATDGTTRGGATEGRRAGDLRVLAGAGSERELPSNNAGEHAERGKNM